MSFPTQTAGDRITALFMKGNALAAKAQYREALKCYEKILEKVPGNLDVINNRANCLSLLGRHELAVASYSAVLAAKPNDIWARNNRATALKHLRRIDEALLDYDHVLKIDPNYSDALYNRGNTLADLGRPKEAVESYRRALVRNRDDPAIHAALASALFDLRLPHEAVESYRRALEIKPDELNVHSDLIFALNFVPEMTDESLQAERAAWGSRFDGFLKGFKHTNEPRLDRRLRVGYVSAHFRRQAATYSFGGVILHHDTKKFEITCYSDTAQEDDVTHLLRSRVGKWRRTSHLPNDELLSVIRADGIDILVDLVGHMKHHRLSVFAHKPAPVQISAWGEPTGTGLKAMDYIFSDPILIPPAKRALLTEKVVDLPNYIGFWSPEPLAEPNPLPALTRGHVTFGSFNRLSKVLPTVLQCWAAILRALPNSQLVLKDRLLDLASQQAPILGALANEGIAPDRVTILDQGTRTSHFAAYHDIDIALDPFPHSGGMTTLDALWMGVPVVTCPGPTISSRPTAACLTAAGLNDYIASDLGNYVELSVAKAHDLVALAELRKTLRNRIENTDFGDPDRYTRAVEAQYRSIWQQWCKNQNGAAS
jgi:predicted O-linked N-acetylglucosamine transferase (SPINDLY family)